MIGPPPLPGEHGAWAMLGIPLALGLTLGFAHVAAWLAVVSVLGAFLAHYAVVPVLVRWRTGKIAPSAWLRPRITWGPIYLVASGAAFAATLATASGPGLGRLSAIAIACAAGAFVYFAGSVLERGRMLAIELTGIAGMSLAAALVAAAGGVADRRAWTAAAISYAYALSSVAFVRTYETGRPLARRAILRCAAAHVAIVGGLVALALLGLVVATSLVALVPVVARTIGGLARPPENLRALGRREIGVAVSLLALAALSLTVAGAP